MPARARLHRRNARTGTHGTGCACRCFLAGRTSTLCSVDASGARELDGGISKAPVSTDTLYCRKSCRRFPGGLNRPRAAAGIRRGVCRKPASYFMNFDLLRILEPSKKAGLRIPAHFLENAGSPDPAYNFKCLLLPASCPRLPQPGVLQLGS